MKCKEFTTLVDSYMNGDISDDKRELFEQHFFKCDKCFVELKLKDRLKSKKINIVLKGKKPILSMRPIFIIASIFLLIVSSIIVINRINYSKILFEITQFEPPAYITSETRNLTKNATFLEAMDYYKKKQFSEALGVLEKIKNEKGNPQITFFKGTCYILTGNLKTAIKNFDIIINDMNPSYYDEAIYFKGIALIRMNRIKEAKNNLENLAQMFSPYASRAKLLLEKINTL